MTTILDYIDNIPPWLWFGILVITMLAILIVVLYSETMTPKKVVVFDLDETLGCFSQLGALKDIIEAYENTQMTQRDFNLLMDENPAYVRPGIIDAIRYAVLKRDQGKCDSIMIYTNNTGGRTWPRTIASYFDYKIGKRVFDQIIAAYKVNGRQLERGRTSHDKSYADFLRCTGLARGTKVCFFDDVLHPEMRHPNVSYAILKPYTHRYSLPECLIRHYRRSPTDAARCIAMATGSYSRDTLGGSTKHIDDARGDVVASQMIMNHLTRFINRSPGNVGGGNGKGRKRKWCNKETRRRWSGERGRTRARKHHRPGTYSRNR